MSLFIANLAVALGIVLHFGTWLPGGFITPESYFAWSLGTKIAISLVPNLGFTFGFIMMWFRETNGSGGMNWSNVASPVISSDNMTLVHVWGCHLISSLVFTILLWYLDNVRPGKYGVAQPWYFPFTVRLLRLLRRDM